MSTIKKSYALIGWLVYGQVGITRLAEAQSLDMTPGGSASTTTSAAEIPVDDSIGPFPVTPGAAQGTKGNTIPSTGPAVPADSKGNIGDPIARNEVEKKELKVGDSATKKNEETIPEWERSSKISVGGYVHTAFISNFDSGKVANEFRVRDARIQLKWSHGSLLDGQVEAELAKENEDDSADQSAIWSPLRDAFVRVSPLKQIAIRMGQFRRPFSRIGLTSPRTLKLINRGVSDAWVNGELLFGARDIGLQLEGTFGKKWGVEYAIGVFNGTGRNQREIDGKGAKDFVGRITGHLGKHVEVAANVANKNWDNPPATVSYKSQAWMFGGDVAVDYKGLFGMVEGGYGDNYQSIDNYLGADSIKTSYVLGLVAYKIKLTDVWDTAVEPVAKFELLSVTNGDADSSVYAGTLGANLYLGSLFRLMIQGDRIKPTNTSALPSNLGEADPLTRLTVQFALHTK
jgi:hypothetical protein